MVLAISDDFSEEEIKLPTYERLITTVEKSVIDGGQHEVAYKVEQLISEDGKKWRKREIYISAYHEERHLAEQDAATQMGQYFASVNFNMFFDKNLPESIIEEEKES